MDYTPIGIGRVLLAFALTIVVGVAPLLAVALNGHSSTFSASGGYGGFVLGLGSLTLVLALIGLARLAVAARRRVVGRPSQA